MSDEAFRDEAIKDNPVEEPTSQTVHDPVCHMFPACHRPVATPQSAWHL